MSFARRVPLLGLILSSAVAGAVLPLHFETGASGALVSRSRSYGLRLENAGMIVTVRDAARHRAAAITTVFRGANPGTHPEGDHLLSGRANYLLGGDARQWRTNTPIYERAVYRNVYPGIDLVFHGSEGALEYDFVVQPGADPRRIAMDVKGGSAVRLASDGSLAVTTPAGNVRWKAPQIYQEKDGVRQSVTGRFTRHGHRIAFALGEYDKTRALVIDPTLVYASYLGGSDNEGARGVAVDSSGNFYVTGFSFSTNMPVTAASFQPAYHGGSIETDLGGDAFVAKYSPSGAVVYITYLGGRGDDAGTAIAVDSAGNAYVTGFTSSADFPTTNGVFQRAYAGGTTERWLGAQFGDAFVAKLNPSGNALVFSTYLGGSGEDKATAIAVDGAGSVYIGGATLSANFPTRNPAQSGFKGSGGIPDLISGGGPIMNSGDGFVAKLKADASDLVYSTYLGGSLDDAVTALAVDSAGNVYAGGGTLSKDFPTQAAYQGTYGGGSTTSAQPVITTGDGFVTKFDATGKVAYSTYLGGSADDIVMGIAVDGAGSAYVTGFTTSANFPVTAKAAQTTFKGPAGVTGQRGFAWGDAFVTKLTPAGTGLAYSTYLGGTADDAGMAIAVDPSGNAFVGGFASSRDFPVSADALQKTFAGLRTGYTDNTGDGFLTKVSPDGSTFVYSSYFGGTNDDAVTGVAVDSKGTVYVAGLTTSANLQTTSGAAQPKFAGENANFSTETFGDAFVAIVSGLGGASSAITAVLNGFSLTAALAPGTLASVLGANLPTSTSAGATVNGTPATVVAATATQWSIVIPLTVSPGPATVQVGNSAPFNVTVFQYAPALSTLNGGSTGDVAALHADSSQVSPTKPAASGEVITMFATGLGAVDNNNAVTGTVGVSIGGSPAQVLSAVNTQPGLYRVSLKTPTGLPGGEQNIVLSIGGLNSNTLTLPVAGATGGPVITAVQNGASFQPGVAPNTWFTIAGTSLSATSDVWDSSIVNGQFPTTLDRVGVVIGGQDAYVQYISPTQINAVAPNIPPGPTTLTVTNSFGTSAAFPVTVQTFSPGFFIASAPYIVATRQDFSLAIRNGTFTVPTTAAKPGDVIILWGTGFGPTSPTAPVGVPVDKAYFSANAVTVTLTPAAGGAPAPATVYGAALAPGYAALYQVAIQIPDSLADGDYSIVATVGGVQSPASARLTVQR